MHPLLSRSVLANAVFFLAGGVGIGAWAASLPAFSIHAGLSNGELGIVLLCFALGAISTMTSVGRWIPRVGTVKISLVGAGVFGLALALLPHGSNALLLAAAVTLAGASFGSLDVAMNTEASIIETGLRRPIMSSLHGVFSVGGLVGSGFIARLLGAGMDVVLCLTVAGLLVTALSLGGWLTSALPRGKFRFDASAPTARPQPNSPGEPLAPARAYMVGALAFVVLLAEGALLDWIAIYLVQVRGWAESQGAFGLAIFAATMAIGRFGGDVAVRRLGAPLLLGAGAGIVILALLGILTIPAVPVTLTALAAAGLGIANGAPLIFSAAGRLGGATSASMSRVVTMGYVGLLVGPPFMGTVAEFISLEAALAAVAASLITIVVGRNLVRG